MAPDKHERNTARDGHVEILDAVGRAKAFRLCLRRIWAVASSLPGGAERLSTLIPAPDTFSVPSHNLRHHEHEQCTFDFCEHSRVDFTSVGQRHEKRHGKIQCDGDCDPRKFILSERTWREKAAIWKLDGQSLLDASDPYMAISHVWADGTGAGTWGSRMVNECLWEFFCDIARDFQCEGCWWDTISIPSDDEARAKALNNMQNNYTDARITLVHDLYLREWEWIDAETACFAIVMSPWYSRGWTALELAKSHKVKILFKSKSENYVIKDLDVDILAKVPGNSQHHDLAQSIHKLRNTSIQSLGDLLAVLGPRDTSKPRDLPIISGLLAGVDVSTGLSQQEIYQRILRKLGKVAQGHLFHNSATMASSGFSWCPSNILDMPLAVSGAELLEIRENGDVQGVWKVYPTSSVKPKAYIWKDTHPLNQVFLKSALSEKSVANHVLLLENEDHAPSGRDKGPMTRALLFRFVTNEESAACCHFVGPVYFISDLGSDLRKQPHLKMRVRIGSTEKFQGVSGRAWDHLAQMVGAEEATGGGSMAESTEATTLKTRDAISQAQDGPFLADIDFKDWKAILYSDKDVYKSLFEKECRLQIPKGFSSESYDTMKLYFRSDQASDNSTAPSQAFIYGHKVIVEKATGWLGNTQSYKSGELMLLGLDENDKIKVNMDDEPGMRSLAGTALLLATDLATVEETRSKAEPLVTLLLSHHAPHDPGSTGQCPLHLALEKKACSLVEKLLMDETNPAPPDVANKKGKTAIHLAAKLTGLDESSTVKLLVDKTDKKMLDAKDNEKEQAALHRAAKKGNLKLTECLIGRGASTNIQDSDGRTPLYYAAAENHHHIVRALLEYNNNNNDDDNGEHIGNKGQKNKKDVAQNLHDAQASAKGSDRIISREQDMMTALWLAAQKGYALVVEVLIEYHADVHAKDKHERTPLMLAAQGGHRQVVDKLLNKGNPKRFQEEELNKALLLAAKGNYTEIINMLHGGGARSGLQDPDGMTALHLAIEAKDEVSAELLVRSQSDLNLQDHKKRSALILAADKELNEVVRVLLKQNVDAKLQDSHRRTVLHWAAMRGNLDIMGQLLCREDTKNYINEADNMGRTALHWAAYQHWRHKDAMELILESHPQYDTKDNGDCTPLILAAERGNLEPVKQLLEKKADPLTTNKEGLTALDQAAINGHGDLVTELLRHVDNDKAKMKALELAADHKHLSVAIKLQKSIIDPTLRRSATRLILLVASATPECQSSVENFVKSVTDPDQKDKNGQTPLMLSVKNRNRSLTTALLSLNINIDIQDTQGMTVLMLASMSDDKKDQVLLRKLLIAQADPNIRDNQGYTALHHAIAKGLFSNAKLLLTCIKGKVNLSIVDKYKRTALHVALEQRGSTDARVQFYHTYRSWSKFKFGGRGDFETLSDRMCRLLLNHGARLDAEDAHGQTPLHWAAGNHPSTVNLVFQNPGVLWKSVKLNSQNDMKQTPLLLASEAGHALWVKKLLDEGADANIHDLHGCTPLSQAARNGHKEVLDVLLNIDKRKPDLNARDAMGRTALLLAAENGNLDVVRALLKHKANPHLVDFSGSKAWQKAMDKGYTAIVNDLLSQPSRYIVEDKRDINVALILASRRCWTRLAKVLLEKEADTSFQDSEWCTALHMAAMNGHREMLEILLEKPRVFPVEDGKGRTALSQAAECGFASIVGLLLGREEVKADITGWKVPGALLLAAEKGYTRIVELILETTMNDGDFGIDLNIRDSAGRTAMALAAANGNKAIVELLLDRNADSNILDDHEKTALHHAAWGGYDDVVEVLLEHNVDLRDTLDKRGQSALHLAAERASEKVIERLLEKRANVNATAKDGQTALHRAAWGGSFNAVASLCKSGADTLIRDGSKNKPWQVAAEKGNESIVEKLLRSKENLRDEHISNKQGLIFAAEMGYAGIARSLLERKAQADTTDENGLTPLHWAMMRGDQAFVELLLQENWRTNINALDQNQQTPLCHGVLAGRAAVVKMLLRGTADPNKPDKDGRTALHHAAWQCNWEMVRILVDHKADVHVRDRERKKAWQLAAENGGHQVVSLLLGKEPDVRSLSPKLEELFLHVVKQGRAPMVYLLIKNGANINAKDQYGSSAFGLAAEHGNNEVVDLLLSENANPGIAGWKGKTAILWAATAGYTKVARSILDNMGDLKADIVNHRDYRGQTALLKALEKKQDNVAKLLLDKALQEMDVDIQGKHQKTALHLAAEEDKLGFVKLLLRKAKQDIKDEWGRTALLVAAEKGKRAVVETLLDGLTDSVSPSDLVNSSDNQGRTALLVAAERGDSETIEKLLQKGANENHADNLGRTPLLIATQNGNKDIVELLLKHGADHTQGDSQARTPLRLAVTNGDKTLVEMFLNRSNGVTQLATELERPLHPGLFQLAVRSGNNEVLRLISDQIVLYEENLWQDAL